MTGRELFPTLDAAEGRTLERLRQFVSEVGAVGSEMAEIERELAQARSEAVTLLDGSELASRGAMTTARQRRAIEILIARAQRFFRRERPRTFARKRRDGSGIERRLVPLRSVGLAVGTGAWEFMDLLAWAVAASVAGVRRRVACAPPAALSDSRLCATLSSLSIDEVVAMEGARACGALAWGGGGFDPVDKVFGATDPGFLAARESLVARGEIAAGAGVAAAGLAVVADPGTVAADAAGVLAAHVDGAAARWALLLTSDERLLQELATLLGARAGVALVLVEDPSAALPVIYGLCPQAVALFGDGSRALARRLTSPAIVVMGGSIAVHLSLALAGPGTVSSADGRVGGWRGVSVADFVAKQDVVRITPRRVRGMARLLADLEIQPMGDA